MWWIVLFAVAGALLVVLFVDAISRIIMKKRLSAFLNNYKLISLGMTKEQVVNLFGDKYTQNATIATETLCWNCDTNTSIQRELYSKKEEKKTIIVEFSDNKVVSYTMQ